MLTDDGLQVLCQPMAGHADAQPHNLGATIWVPHPSPAACLHAHAGTSSSSSTAGSSGSSRGEPLLGSQLTHLCLHGAWGVGDPGLQALASCTGLVLLQLTELVHATDAGVSALSGLTCLSRLVLDAPAGVRVVTLQVRACET